MGNARAWRAGRAAGAALAIAATMLAAFACGEQLPAASTEPPPSGDSGVDNDTDGGVADSGADQNTGGRTPSTVGVYRTAAKVFEWRYSNTTGASEDSLSVNPTTPSRPFAGHWNDPSFDDLGYRVEDPSQPTFHLLGPTEQVVAFGGPVVDGWPVVGDWNGDGVSTVGFYVPETGAFLLNDANTGGQGKYTFTFAAPNGIPIVGDWDGDGTDGIGVFFPDGTFQLKNTVGGGNADFTIVVANAGGFLPFAGDWNGDGVTTVGLFQPGTGTFRLLEKNASGSDEQKLFFGAGIDSLPIAGRWRR